MKVLLVDDNTKINATLKQFLEMKNFEVVSCINGKDALKLIDNEKFGLYIIDIHLPKIGGLDIVKYIRTKDLNTPIIMITSSLEIDNFVTAFENGANEYIKKPFHLEEFEIRINNLLNNNKIIHLRKKERKLLTILLKNKNNTINSNNLISYIWENEEKENYPLRQLVSVLKNKVPFFKDKIKVIPKIGYRLEL